uniref:Uncharacterized protein n=1 Tax=Rhizophora mucronata TaxID=61149 RepID=A0A2P2PYZ4_RHIMU
MVQSVRTVVECLLFLFFFPLITSYSFGCSLSCLFGAVDVGDFVLVDSVDLKHLDLIVLLLKFIDLELEMLVHCLTNKFGSLDV